MPKIINTTKQDILDITDKLISEGRYDEINCRNLAYLANISIGTLYNMFKSKMEIIAYLLINKWNKIISQIDLNVKLDVGIKNIYIAVFNFVSEYKKFWTSFNGSQEEYINQKDKHSLLINQLESLVINIATHNNTILDENTIYFICENILLFSSKLENYDKIEKIFNKLIKGDA